MKDNNNSENPIPTLDVLIPEQPLQQNNTQNESGQNTINQQNVNNNNFSMSNQEQQTVTPKNLQIDGSNTPINENTEKNNKKKPKIFVILAVIILVLVGGLFIYNSLNNNPTKILTNAINDAYKDFNKALKDLEKNNLNMNLLKDTINFSGDLTVNGDLFKNLENDKITYNGGIDFANQKFELTAAVFEKEMALLDATAFIKNGKLYIKSNYLFDNTYYIDDIDFDKVVDVSELEKTLNSVVLPSTDDIDYIVKSLKDAIIASLDKNEMVKSKEEIQINNEKVNANKITYSINSKSTEKFVKSIIKEINSNDKLLKIVSQSTNVEVDKLKDVLKDAKENASFDNMENGKINIYTVGITNKVAKIELVVNDVTISYSNYKDNIYFLINSKEENVKFEIVGNSKDNITSLDVNFNGTKYATFTIRSLEINNIDFDYDINISKDLVGIEFVAKGTIKLVNKNNNNNEINGNVEFSTDANINGEKINFSIKLNYKINIGGQVAEYDITDAKNDITNEDQIKALNVIEGLKDTNIYKFLVKYIDEDIFKPTVNDNSSSNNYKCSLATCDYSSCKIDFNGNKTCKCIYTDPFDYNETIYCIK